MGRRRWVDDERAGIADVGEVADHLESLDERRTCLPTTIHAEGEHGARSLREVAIGQRPVGRRLQPRVGHPSDRRMPLQEPGHRAGVGDVFLHSLGQGLEALEQQEGVEGRHRGPHVPELFGPQLRAERKLSEVLPEPQPVVTGVRFGHLREATAPPVEPPGLHDHAADGRAVPADELGGRVHHDVGPVLQWPAQVRRGEGGVHHQGQVVGVGHVGEGNQVGDGPRRVADDLGVEETRVGVDACGERLGVVSVHEAGLDAEAAQRGLEHGVGAAVERRGGHEVAALLGQCHGGQELGGLARGGGHGPDPAIQAGHAFLEGRCRGVRDAGVDGAVLLECEQVGGIGHVVEHEAGRLVDGHRPGTGGRIRLPTGVECTGPESPLAICHEREV